MINIGILGCSDIVTKSLLPFHNRIDNFKICSISSRSIDKAKLYQEKYNIACGCTYSDLIKSKDINCVYIAMPPTIQPYYIKMALINNKHVLVEKPISISVEKYRDIARCAMDNNLYVLEAIMVQHHPWQQYIHSIVNEKLYGNLKKINTIINMRIPPKLINGYRTNKELGGGVFTDTASYWLQFLQTITTLNISDLTTCVKHWEHDVDFKTTIDCRINDIDAKFECSFIDKYEASHVLYFENATVSVKDFFRPNIGKNKLKINIQDKLNNSTDTVFGPENYYENQINYLINLIQNSSYSHYKNEIEKAAVRVKYLECIRNMIYD